MQRALLVAILVAAVALAAVGHAHPIDEVPGNAVLDLRTTDNRRFDLTIFFQAHHLEAYRHLIAELGLPPQRDRAELARNVREAFAFDGCDVQLVPGDPTVDRPGFVGIRLALTCRQRLTTLVVRRVAYRRQQTRTTLYVQVAQLPHGVGKPPEPLRLLVPPSAERAEIPLDGRPPPAPTSTLPATWKDSPLGAFPTDALAAADLPPPQATDLAPPQTTDLAPRAWLQPPPWPILRAWAEEGARHLLLGPDHLLFLLTLVLAAARGSGLVLAVTAFSLGHVVSMAVALVLRWPPLPWLDVVIGGTIAWSAWQARKPDPQSSRKLAAMAGVFGLIHGLGFGYGLQALVGGFDALAWPLLCFGGGLDLAQLLFVAVAWGIRQLAWRFAAAERLRPRAAMVLVASGILAAALAAVPGP